MSPSTRISVAMQRPDSSRKIRPTCAAWMRVASATTAGLVGEAREGPHLDRPADRVAHLRGPAERRVEVVGIDHVEAGEVLLRLDERPVRRQRLAAGDPDD